MQATASIMQVLQTLVQQGGMGTLVTPQNIYNTISEYIEQAGYKNPDQFISNPANMPPPPPPQPSVEEKVQAQKAQVELQKLQLQAKEIQSDTMIKEAELDLKKREAAIEMALKRKELQLKESELKLNQAELVLESVQERPVAIGKT